MCRSAYIGKHQSASEPKQTKLLCSKFLGFLFFTKKKKNFYSYDFICMWLNSKQNVRWSFKNKCETKYTWLAVLRTNKAKEMTKFARLRHTHYSFPKWRKKTSRIRHWLHILRGSWNLALRRRAKPWKKSSFFLLNISIKYNTSKSLFYSNSNKGHLVSCTEHLLIFF